MHSQQSVCPIKLRPLWMFILMLSTAAVLLSC